MSLEEVETHWEEKREEIEDRLEEFEQLRDSDNERLFKELVFVILTSQTSAKKAWEATEELENKGLLENPDLSEIVQVLLENDISYEESKARYIVENRKMLSQPTLEDPSGDLKLKQKIDPDSLDQTRKWLAENVKGTSWKGSSHFLRNIGYGNSFAILSSHISNKLSSLGVFNSSEQPSSREEYLQKEKKVQQLAEKLDIDVKALDLVLWSMETGEVFK